METSDCASIQILLVEDDKSLLSDLIDAMKFCGWSQMHCSTGKEGLRLASEYNPALLVLDVGLPDISGFDVLKTIRDTGSGVLILMLTGRDGMEDKLAGLSRGADDYLTKPFELDELIARIRALLRRSKTVNSDILTYAHISLDTASGKLMVAGKEVKVFPVDLAVLEFLLRRPEHVFCPEDIIQHAWKSDLGVSSESVRSCILRLRKVIDIKGFPRVVQNVHGVGYKLSLKED